GRIGSRGQQKIHVFDSEAKAVDLLLALLRKKRSRGYRVMR
ncbi:WGR domain-containing protein, partial [Rhizobium johnstonii]